jgi:LPXTG-motif cell wall-anchored protein
MITLALSLLLCFLITYSFEWGSYLLFKASYALGNDALLSLSLSLRDYSLNKPLLFGLCVLTVFGLVYLKRKKNVSLP